MGRFTVIPSDTFNGLQLDAGVLLRRFNPANPVPPADADIICATTGGINPSCVPTFSDLGEDVDNVPVNMKELKHLDSWECKIATTSLGTTPELIKLALGCADIDAQTSAIIPRKDLAQTDFSDIWWVGDRADGGLVAIQLKNALSTAGFSLQTTKNGKGQIALEITGHVSIDAQDVMPMVFYSMDAEEGNTFKVSQTLAHVTSSFKDEYISSTDAFEATLTAETDYTIANVIVTMAGEDITATAYDDSTDVVSIATVTGNIVIVATATAE
jgi:hypothetical protein